MVSTENLKVLDHETEIFTPVHGYGDAIRYIFRENGVKANIAWITKRFENEEDKKTRTYWADRFNNADDDAGVIAYSMLRIRTHFDPDELFDFLLNSMIDPDVQKYVAYFASGPHVPDPNIVE